MSSSFSRDTGVVDEYNYKGRAEQHIKGGSVSRNHNEIINNKSTYEGGLVNSSHNNMKRKTYDIRN
jgi:hypothetical protein